MRKLRYLLLLSLCCFAIHARSQEIISAPQPQPGTLSGIVVDTDDAAIPGATVTLVDEASVEEAPSTKTDMNGYFTLPEVRSASPVHVVVSATGFASWEIPACDPQSGAVR